MAGLLEDAIKRRGTYGIESLAGGEPFAPDVPDSEPLGQSTLLSAAISRSPIPARNPLITESPVLSPPEEEEGGGLFEPITKTPSAIFGGVRRLRQLGNLAQGDFEELAEVTRSLDEDTYSPSRALREFNESEGIDAFRKFGSNPLIAVEIAANSLPTSTAAILGGAVGALAPPSGAMWGIGLGSLAAEGGLAFLEGLGEQGVDLRDGESIEAAFNDSDVILAATEHAARRGVPVAVIDALTFGLASKFGVLAKGLFKAGKTGAAVRELTKGLGYEMAGGATGEVAGSLVAGDEIRVPDVLAEAIGELVPGGAEIVLSTRGGVTTARAIRQAEKEGSATPYEPEVPVEETPDGETKPFGADLTPGQWTRRMGIAKDLYGKMLRDLTAEERRVVEVKASKEEVMEPERPPTPYPPQVPEPEGEVEVEEPERPPTPYPPQVPEPEGEVEVEEPGSTPESKDPAGEAETPAPPDVKVGDIVFHDGENYSVKDVRDKGKILDLALKYGQRKTVASADVTIVPSTPFSIGDKVSYQGKEGEIVDATFKRESRWTGAEEGPITDEPVYAFRQYPYGLVDRGLSQGDLVPRSKESLGGEQKRAGDASTKALAEVKEIENQNPDAVYGGDKSYPAWAEKENDTQQQIVASGKDRTWKTFALLRRVVPVPFFGPIISYRIVSPTAISESLFTTGKPKADPNFSPEEVADATALLNSYKARDGKLNEAHPDGPFEGTDEPVVTTDSVPPAYIAWIKKIRADLGIMSKFFVMTAEEASDPALIEKHKLYGSTYGRVVKHQPSASPGTGTAGETLAGPVYSTIMYRPDVKKSLDLETIAHEVGHTFESQVWDSLNKREQAAVEREFQAHLRLKGTAQQKEFLKAHASMKFFEMKYRDQVSDAPAASLPGYYEQRGEFVANQIAKWAVSSEQPVSVLDKFFKRLADGLRRLYASAKGKENLPKSEIKRILDRRAEAVMKAGEDFQGRVEALAEAEDIQRGKDTDAEADRAVQAEEEVEEEAVEPKYKRTTPALGTTEREKLREDMDRLADESREAGRLRGLAQDALRKTERRVRSSNSKVLKEKQAEYKAASDKADEAYAKRERAEEDYAKVVLEDKAESDDTAVSLGALVALGEMDEADARAEITKYVEKIAEDENIAKDVRKEAVKDTVGAALNGTVGDTASSLKYSVERIRREQAEQTARDLKATALEEEKAEARKKVEALSSLTDEQRQSYLDQIDKATEIGDEYRGSSTVAGSVKQAIEANDKASEASDKEAARLKALGGDRSVVEAGANELYNKPFDELNKTQKRKVLYSKLLDMERGFPVSDLTEAELLELSKNVQLVAEAKDRNPSYISKKFGFITDGHFLVLDKAVAKKLRDAYWRNELKKAKTDVAEKAVLAERATVDKEDGPDTSPLIPGVKGDSLFFQGYSGRRDNTPIAIYSTGSKQIMFDAEYIAAIKKLFPNAKLTMPEGKDGRSPATFVEGGKIKALVMPLAPRDSGYSIDPAFRPGDAVVEPTIQSLETEIAEEPQANLLGEVEEVEETEVDTDTQDRQIESLETSIGDSYQGTDMNESPNTPELSHLETLVTTEPEENVLRREATKKSGVGTMVSVDPKGSEGFWKTILKSAGLGSLREFKFHHVETLSIFREWAKKAGARAEEVVSVARHITGIDKLRAGMMINPGKTGELWNSPTDHLGNDLRDSQGVKVKSVVEIFETVKQRGLSDEASRYIAARTGLTRYYTRSNNKTINEMSQDVWDFFLARREMQVGEVKEAVAKFIEDEVISEVQGEAIIANLGVLKDDVTQNADHILDTVNPGFSRAEAEAIKAEGDNNLILKDAADDFFRLTDALLTFMEKMSPNLHDRLQLMRDVSYNAKTNLYEYAPLVKVRAIDDVRARFSGIFDKNAVSKFSRVSGVSSATDPITDPVLQWVLSVSPMIKGAARAQLMDAIAAHIGPSTMGDTELVSAKEAGVSLEEQKINEALAKESGDGEGAMLLFDMLEPARASSRDGKPIFTLRQGKEVVYVKVHDELLFKGITGVDTRNMGAAFDLFFGMPARMLRMGATGLSLGFNFFTNPIRDFVQILGQSELRGPKGLNTFELVAFWGQAAAMVFRDRASRAGISSIGNKESNAEFMELYRRLGVHMGKLLNVDAAQAKNLTAQVEGRAKEHYKGMLDNVADYLTGSEDVGRISVGLATLKVWEKQGRIKANADGSLPKLSDTDMRDLANIMQQGSIDFRQGGDFGKVINQMIPFWNVNILGIERFRKSVEDNPKGTILWGLTAITLPTLALWAMNRDEDWYKRLTPDQKALYWHFNLPGTDTVLRIPKAFEWGSLFGTVPEALFERLVSENPDHADEILGSVAGLLSPLQSGKDLVSFETLLANLPLTARVGAEYATNRDFFFNRSIVPESERFLPPGEQKSAFTSGLARLAGEMFPDSISPRKVDFLVRSLTGGLGSDIVGAIDFVLLGQDRSDSIQNFAAGELAELPVIGRGFLRGGTKGSRSRFVDKIYEDLGVANARSRSKDRPETEAQRDYREQVTMATGIISSLHRMAYELDTREQRIKIREAINQVAKNGLKDRPDYRDSADLEPVDVEFSTYLRASGDERNLLLWKEGQDYAASHPDAKAKDIKEFVRGLPAYKAVSNYTKRVNQILNADLPDAADKIAELTLRLKDDSVTTGAELASEIIAKFVEDPKTARAFATERSGKNFGVTIRELFGTSARFKTLIRSAKMKEVLGIPDALDDALNVIAEKQINTGVPLSVFRDEIEELARRHKISLGIAFKRFRALASQRRQAVRAITPVGA